MKKIIYYSTILITSILLGACSNDSDGDTTNNLPEIDVTYSKTVKLIIDSNCLNCHASPPTSGAPMSLISYVNVKDAVQNKGLIGRIEDGSMPPSGNLTSTQVKAIKDWKTGGFIQ